MEVPVRPNAYYFSIDNRGALYEAMMKVQAIAIYAPSTFTELWMELFASRINVSFPPVIHLITNDDWRNMAQCSIIDLSPPTPPRIGFNPPSVGGFFSTKFRLRGSVQLNILLPGINGR